MLIDSGSTSTIINNNLSEQVITRVQRFSMETKLVGPSNANAEMIGETYVELGISGKKVPYKYYGDERCGSVYHH